MVFDPVSGVLYASYSPGKNLAALQRLGPDGVELAHLNGRTGRLALDREAGWLYAVQEGVITRVDPTTLALRDAWRGPARVDQVTLHPRFRQLYVLNSARSRLAVISLDALQPFDMRPQAIGALPDATMDGLAVVSDGGGGRWVFAEAGGAPYRSRDGKLWERLPVGTLPTWGRLTVAADGALFYAGQGSAGADGVWRSTDFGASWALLAEGLTDLRANQPVRAAGAGTAYFIGETGGLLAWQAGAGGASGRWEQRLAPKSEWEGPGRLALAPDGTLFLASFDSLRRSTDGGRSWVALQPPARNGSILGFSGAYTATRTLIGSFGETEQRLARSTDAGRYLGAGRHRDGFGPLRLFTDSRSRSRRLLPARPGLRRHALGPVPLDRRWR